MKRDDGVVLFTARLDDDQVALDERGRRHAPVKDFIDRLDGPRILEKILLPNQFAFGGQA